MNGYNRRIDEWLIGADDRIEGGESFTAGIVEGGNKEHAGAGDKCSEDGGCEDECGELLCKSRFGAVIALVFGGGVFREARSAESSGCRERRDDIEDETSLLVRLNGVDGNEEEIWNYKSLSEAVVCRRP